MQVNHHELKVNSLSMRKPIELSIQSQHRQYEHVSYNIETAGVP